MKNLPELDTKQYIKLAIEGMHKLLGEDATNISLEEYTDFLKSPEGAMFSAGYVTGLGYHPDSLEALIECLESLAFEELEALVKEELQ